MSMSKHGAENPYYNAVVEHGLESSFDVWRKKYAKNTFTLEHQAINFLADKYLDTYYAAANRAVVDAIVEGEEDDDPVQSYVFMWKSYRNGKWYWSLKAANHEIVAFCGESDGYASRSACIVNYECVRDIFAEPGEHFIEMISEDNPRHPHFREWKQNNETIKSANKDDKE